MFVIAPLVLLNLAKVRNNPQIPVLDLRHGGGGLYGKPAECLHHRVAGQFGVYYVPKWTEFAATLATIAAAVVAFRYAVIYLDILPKNPPRERWMVPSASAQA